MEKQNTQDLNLEDIIKEISELELAEDELTELPEEIAQELMAVQTHEKEEEAPQEEAAEEKTEETPAPEEEEAPAPKASAVTSDTIRLERIPETKGKVRDAVAITEEEEPAPAEAEAKEPFSQEWEPEYEQPIGEYVPASPIAFRPKSRLKEFKSKLVNGPEKQYYLQLEQGTGKLQIAIFFSLLVVLISAGATALYALGMVQPERLRLMVFGQFLAMLVSALLGSFQLIEGGADLLKGRFSLNTLLLFTFILCCVDGIMCLQQQRIPCCAAFSLQVTMSLWSTYQMRTTRLGQLDTMRKATRLDSIVAVEDFTDGKKGLLRGQGEVEHFMDTYEDAPQQQKILHIYALVALGVSIGAGVLAGVLHGISAGVQVAAVTALAAMPASMFITLSRPMAILERRMHALGTVLCGWQGAWGLVGKVVFPVSHSDLFPNGSIKMNGVKFFGGRQPDQIIAYAAALIKADGGALEPLFTQLLEGRSGIHYDPVNFNRYDGGIGAEVNGEPVLVGTLPFLKRMGVEIPDGLRVNQAVCAAVDGEMCGLFAITYAKDRKAAAGLATLCGYRKLQPALVSSDFILTPEFVRNHFFVNPKKLLLPEHEERRRMAAIQPEEGAKALALITGEGLACFAYAATGARSLKTAVKWGIAIHLTGGILGMVMMLVLAYLGATDLLTPASMFLYELIWMVPGLLVTEWTRNI